MKSEKTSMFADALTDGVAYLFLALFVYTAVNKILDFDTFSSTLVKSVILGAHHKEVAVAVIVSKLVISAALVFPTTRQKGIHLSLTLFIIFTIYLVSMLSFAPKLPCSCGGLTSSMSWKAHIWLNIALITAGLLSSYLFRKNHKDFSREKR